MIVIHSKKFCVITAGEIDFLICNKNRGLILFEVKSAAKISAYNSALKQLQKAQEAVKRKIKNISRHVPVRYAVVLPNVLRKREKEFAPEVCYMEDLQSSETFTEWLNDYMPSLDEYLPLANECFDKLVSAFLETITDRPLISSVYERLIRLTPQQAALLEGLPEEFYISGPAGSGKTEVLIIRASDEELHNQRKLVVVFNSAIRDHLKKWVVNYGLVRVWRVVTNYHLLSRVIFSAE